MRTHWTTQISPLQEAPARGRTVSESRVFPSLDHVWVAASLATVFVLLNLRQIAPNDFWWHARIGEIILTTRTIPSTDLFSFTQAGQPWVYQSWLAEIIFYGLLSLGGPPLVIFAHAAIITLAFAVLLFIVHRYTADGWRLAGMAVFASILLSANNWNIRPQTFSFLFFALTLYLIERYRWQGGRSLWLLPPLMLLWANIHGAFIFGLLLIGLFALARIATYLQYRPTIAPHPLIRETGIAALAALAVFGTPTGLGMVSYVLGFLQHDITQNLNIEFQPATIRTPEGAPLFAAVFLLGLLLLRSGYRPPLVESLRLLAFGFLAFYTVRSIVWFGFVLAPVLAAALAHWLARRKPSRSRQAGNAALLAGLATAALLSLPWLRPHLPLPEAKRSYVAEGTPGEAVVALCQSSADPIRLFAEMGYASYVEWACPEVQIFVDTRMEQYPTEQWRDYLNLSTGRYEWEQILSNYQVTHLMLRFENQQALISAVQQSSAWQQIFSDDDGVLLIRNDS